MLLVDNIQITLDIYLNHNQIFIAIPMTKSSFKQQIAAAEARYAARSSHKSQNQVNFRVGGDWRQVESPQRVMRRINSLGLHELGSQLIATEAVTEPVRSIINLGKQVSLLERIIEENDLISSRFLPIGASLSRSVGRITIRQNGRHMGYGTGFLVSPELLLTNHHVLESAELAVDSFVEFDFFERQNGRTKPTVIYQLQPQKFFLNDRSLDYAFVAVATESDQGIPLAERGFIPLIAESGKALIGEPVNVIQHPGGNPQQIAIRNNNITDIVDDFLHYAADTERGSSGSPVFNMQWELAALHHAGVPMRNEQGEILMTDGRVFDQRSENIERIAWQANEGVRISSIVKDVQSKLAVDSEVDNLEFFEGIIQNPLDTLQPAKNIIQSSATLQPKTEFNSQTEDYSMDLI